jgi:hypothetical protein
MEIRVTLCEGFYFCRASFYTGSTTVTLGCNEKARKHLYTPTHRRYLSFSSWATRFLA